MIALKYAGSSYRDHGGVNYVEARIEVYELEYLKKSIDKSGGYDFACKRFGLGITFHPTPKHAQAQAIKDLPRVAESITKAAD